MNLLTLRRGPRVGDCERHPMRRARPREFVTGVFHVAGGGAVAKVLGQGPAPVGRFVNR